MPFLDLPLDYKVEDSTSPHISLKYVFKHDALAPSLQAYLISEGRDNLDGFA